MSRVRRYRRGLQGDWDRPLLDKRLQELKDGQALPFTLKVAKAQGLIQQVVQEHGADKCYLGFSGGRDSAVIAHLTELAAPDVEFVFCDTGLEFTETYDYVRWWEQEFGRTITRTRPMKKLAEVLREDGYPFYSKRIAHILCSNKRVNNLKSPGLRSEAAYKVLVSAKVVHTLASGVRISDKCCYYLKHGPAEKYAAERGFTASILGMRADDSRDRRRNWLDRGCYYPVKKGVDRVWPLAFWSEADVAKYHRLVGLPEAALYAKGFDRNGCRLCGFGCHLAHPNKFELLAIWYPKFWKRAMTKFGYFDACGKLGIRDGRNIRDLDSI